MSKRGALILSVILTAFILVLIGGVVARVLPANAPVSEATPPPSTQEARPAPTNEREPPRPAAPALTPEQAVAIASSFVPGASPAGAPELVSLEGTLAYEVRLNRGHVYLDANSGRLLQDGTRRTGGSQRRWEDDDEDDEHEEDEHEKHSRDRPRREHASERHEYHEDV